MPTGAQPERASRIELILQSLDGLPTLSPIATRVLTLSSRDDADYDEITRLIEADPALTARILGLCRRAGLGLGDRITTVRRALVMLGFEAVRASVLGVSVYELMSSAGEDRDERLSRALGRNAPRREFDRVGFWTYSIGVASAAELIAARARGVPPEEAFIAGLLHGMGRPALDLVLPRAYGQVLELAERRRCESASVEREVLGIDHHAAGRRVAERWGLPGAVRDVIWLHDHPLGALPKGVASDLVRVVATARALCRELLVGFSGDFAPCPPAVVVCEAAGLPERGVEEARARVHQAVAERCEVLGLDRAAPEELLLRSISEANRRLSRLGMELDQRARRGQVVTRVLGEVGEFWSRREVGEDIAGTMGAIARSAARLLGEGRWLAMLDPGEGREWIVSVMDGADGHARALSLAPPEVIAGAEGGLEALVGDEVDREAFAGLVRWAGELLGGARSRSTRLVRASRAGARPACVLFGAVSGRGAPLPESELEPLRETWGAALASAVEHDQSVRLSESLAQSNTALAQAQSRLSEAEAMARLGEMAAGAAHEMNNPLTVIRARAQSLLERLERGGDRAAAGAIVEASEDLSGLITALHEIARPGELQVEPTCVVDVLGEALKRCGWTSTGHVRVVVAPGIPLALIDRDKLAAALAELVGNAWEAAPGEIVTVRVQIEAPDGRLLFRIEDRGAGLSVRAQRHAFDPFFSEKPAGRRRGLGLPRARSLVELHGGTVRLEPLDGGGTAAIVALPRECLMVTEVEQAA